MANRIQVRRDAPATWEDKNPILADGEPGLEKGTGKIKYGDGVTPWTLLPYASEGPAGPPGPGMVEDPGDPGFFIGGA